MPNADAALHSLDSNPASVTEDVGQLRVVWPDNENARIRWSYLIPIAGVHILALLACIPWLFSWTGLLAMLIGVHVFGQGINLGYHRLLTHRSFGTVPWVERVLVFLGLCCMEDTPIKWVSVHRRHHQHSDVPSDPHSPRAGFFWSHVGWLFVHNPDTHGYDAYRRYVPDLVQDRFYRSLEGGLRWVWIYVAHAAAFFVVGAAVGVVTSGSMWGGLQQGLSLLVWGALLRTVVVWHITFSVNSLAHVAGYRNYSTSDDSRNNWLVALFTVGEGWHNNHHQDPSSASNHHRWWELDISYYQIKLLEVFGLAWSVNPPRHFQRRDEARPGTSRRRAA
jgi:stearoyl-CoA desaturase (delta-9 desaturase)